MKKDLIFAPIMVIIGALLFLFDLTGAIAHIAISVAGILVLAVYTGATKKEWKIPALEIIMRVVYALTLISGIVIMNVQNIAPLTIGHKISAIVFGVLLVALFAHKLILKLKK